MIHLSPANQHLAPLERFGLDLLVEASGLLRLEQPSTDVVSLEVVTDPMGTSADPVMQRGPGVVRVAREALRKLGDLAGAVTEQQSTDRDAYGRVPSGSSPMVRDDMVRTPVLNAGGRRLREAVIAAAEGRKIRVIAAWPEGRKWAAALSHDLDVVSWWPLFTGMRMLELGRKGQVGLALESARAVARSIGSDPVTQGVNAILDTERELGIHSTWFVIAGHPTIKSTARGDVTYDLRSKRAGRLLRAILAGGHEIGLHGSFATMENATDMREERARLEEATGTALRGVRQHFLRMRPGGTQRTMLAAGFQYDATFGFPDRSGFRLGAADVVPGWDAAAARESGLVEVPLVWMDRTLSKYGGNERPGDWVDEGLSLADVCRGEGGLWVGLWHPNLVAALGFPGAVEQYRRLAVELRAGSPFMRPIAEIVEWRGARRSVRAHSLPPGGSARLSAGQTTKWPLSLEDEMGRVVETLPWPGAA